MAAKGFREGVEALPKGHESARLDPAVQLDPEPITRFAGKLQDRRKIETIRIREQSSEIHKFHTGKYTYLYIFPYLVAGSSLPSPVATLSLFEAIYFLNLIGVIFDPAAFHLAESGTACPVRVRHSGLAEASVKRINALLLPEGPLIVESLNIIYI